MQVVQQLEIQVSLHPQKQKRIESSSLPFVQVKNRNTRILVPESVATKMNKQTDTRCIIERNYTFVGKQRQQNRLKGSVGDTD